MYSDVIQGKWTEIKGEIHETWGRITPDDLEQTQGDLFAIAGVLQQKYGYPRKDISLKLNDLISKFDLEPTKEALRKSSFLLGLSL